MALTPALAARKLVDFSGPHGWEYSATNLGRAAALKSAPCDGVTGVQRRVLPLVEVRASFELELSELRDIDRGAEDADLASLDNAAHQIAVAENKAVCDAYTQNFNHPDRQWDTVATPERTAAFIARHAAGQPAVAA